MWSANLFFMLRPRTELILKLVVEDYIRSAEPVGSKYLNAQYQIGVSDATVRADLAALEKLEFLRAPHTSAGRIPTEKGYMYYLKNLRDKTFVIKGSPMRQAIKRSLDTQAAMKSVAKQLSELSGETAIVAMDPHWSYYAGVSNLFHKPDFHSLELAQSLSDMIDQFDDVLEKIRPSAEDEPQVFIGSSNPFSPLMATIVVRTDLAGNPGLLGLMGPLRMDYGRNIALVERAKEVIDEYVYE